jgi:flagellar M-ring protein FliF
MAGAPQAAGVPGTPSNLPRSTIQPPLAKTGSGVSRRTENVSFETSRTVRQVKMPRGNLKRISAALLLDQDIQWQGKGAQRKRIAIAPTPEKLKAIRDVVAGVLGIVPERGDQLVIESLPFEQTRALEEANDAAKPAAGTHPPALKLWEDKRVLIGGGVAVLLIVLLLVFRRKSKPTAELEHAPAALSASRPGQHGEDEARTPATGQVGEQTLSKLQLPPITSKAQDMLSQIQESVHKDPVFAANIVRGWLEED